jgi:hypothetical protein
MSDINSRKKRGFINVGDVFKILFGVATTQKLQDLYIIVKNRENPGWSGDPCCPKNKLF